MNLNFSRFILRGFFCREAQMLHQKYEGYYRAAGQVVRGLEAQSPGSGSTESRAHGGERGSRGGGRRPLTRSLGSASELGTLNDSFKVLVEEDI